MLLDAQSNLISRIQQYFTTFDDGRRQVNSLYPTDLERICEFEWSADGVWQPKVNADGTFAMTVTDDDLMGVADPVTRLRPMRPFQFSTQELMVMIVGVLTKLDEVDSSLGILIGKVRT